MKKTTAALAMALLVAASPYARAQTQNVPPQWLTYAREVGGQFQAELASDDDTANQFYSFLENRVLHAKGDAPPPEIVVRAWIGADGAVTRVDFDSLGDAQADATLRQLLTAHPMTEPPPADMLQPLRVRLHLEANPDADAPGATS
ncbi:YbaB/EbfC family DNA-binding protein [Paraburkholderia sp. ZP32-5]|uniref:YbaB/EbfC family DNA-binding protein n=1 Tax=Paraburkholderia sp. ZP32-5 TaxID=2883245 RepID=UPI001F3405A1|nr:YbaB/EbfC family DNA-binding protein [Paraburkholderia sp. ZP32-5]